MTTFDLFWVSYFMDDKYILSKYLNVTEQKILNLSNY